MKNNKNEIELPPTDYQPSKAELEQEINMSGMGDGTVRRTIFNTEFTRKPKLS